MLTILKYLKVRYIDCRLNERAQGMVEYAVLIAFVISIAAYIIYGSDHYEQEIDQTFDGASETLEAADRHSGSK